MVDFCVILFQLKAIDDAISKAEEQVEKFTETAKETKVQYYFIILIDLLYCITRCFYHCIWDDV